MLLYIATETRRAAVWAGPGVKDGDVLATWRPVFSALGAHKNDELDGVLAAVGALGEILKTQCAGDDKHGNELGDGVSS